MQRKSKSLARLTNLGETRCDSNNSYRKCRECGCIRRFPPPVPKENRRSKSAVRDGKQAKPKIISKSKDVAQKSHRNPEALIVTKERTEAGRYAPKRYVTKCYFEPKQIPVSYSETIILTLGSKKKQHFETMMYQTKLVPFRWTESVTTLTPASEGSAFQAHHEVFIPEQKHHYMSLEPQQIAAKAKYGVTV